jgi:hypothetical protein
MENIAVVGSQNDESSGNKLMFVNQGIRALKEWSQNSPDESRSMVLFTGGYTEDQMSQIENAVSNYGGNLVKVNSAEEMTNYINSKSIDNGNLAKSRNGDKITNMDIYSHGVSGAIEFGYGTSNAKSYRLDGSNIGNVQRGAFNDNSTITSYACRTALGRNLQAFGISFLMNTSGSLAQKMANVTGSRVSAFPVRTDYQFTLGTWSERRFGIPKSVNIQSIGGAAFIPQGAAHPVQAGDSPFFLYRGLMNFYPQK